MEHKAIQFEVIRTNPSCWKWIIFVDAIRSRTGVSLTRAVRDNELQADPQLAEGSCVVTGRPSSP